MKTNTLLAEQPKVKLSALVTVSYAMPNAALSAICAQMRKLPNTVVTRDNTTTTVKLVVGDKSKTLLMAMQHSNRKVWLVRAVPNLITVQA